MDKPPPHLVGYARVSTSDQNAQLQVDALIAHGVAVDGIHLDVASGAKKRRQGLLAALKDCRPGDVLVVWKLDRLGRDLHELIETVRKIEAKGANLRCLSQGIDTSTPGGRFIFHIMGAMAEFERELIVERTKAGLAAAKAKGRVGGARPKWTEESRAVAQIMLKKGASVKDVRGDTGISRALLYRWKKEMSS